MERFGAFAILAEILFLVQQCTAIGPLPLNGEWCYWEDPECDPTTWTGKCKTGKMQSPIDLKTSIISERHVIKSYNTIHRLQHFYDDEKLSYTVFNVTNNGHSIQIDIPTDEEPPILIDPFEDAEDEGKKFIFSQFHFHWGPSGRYKNGSEHSINGRRFHGELHIVHYSSDYSSFSEALAATNDMESICVIAILLELSQTPNPYLNSIISKVPKLLPINSTTTVNTSQDHPLRIEHLFPDQLDFYRYHGSLTSPTCDQQILWIVQAHPIPISDKQLNTLRQIRDFEGREVRSNFRELQPLNGRHIRFYKVQQAFRIRRDPNYYLLQLIGRLTL